MILCGLLTLCSSFKKHRYLVILILLLSIICTIFCAISLTYLVSQVHGRLTKMEECEFDEYYRVCSCYVKYGDTKKLFRFPENCQSVKQNLHQLVYGVTSLFAVGCFISICTAASSSYLLWKKRAQNNSLRRISFSDAANRTTTQTRESTFTSPRESFNRYSKSDITESYVVLKESIDQEMTPKHGVNNFSVGTQTPSFMLPVADLIYQAIDADYIDLIIEDEPPPCYNDAIASLDS